MTTEERLAALEAEVRALRLLLQNRTRPPAPPPVLPSSPPPAIRARSSAEVRLGSYWVTRIGAILVLLAAIFLAAYLSIYSSAPVRLGELGAAAVVTLAIAYWQQSRQNLRFALVLHSLGDALVFFTAFAAYAFDATRVIDGVAPAIGAQTLAGVFVCGHALQRRAEGSATFSLVLLTWVAGFSLMYQHSATTLGYVAAITLIAAVLRGRWGWNGPLLFAAIAGPCLTAWLADEFPLLHGPVALTWTLLPLLVAAPAALLSAPVSRLDRAVTLTATGVALGAALWARYGPVPAFPSQLLFAAVGAAAVAGLFAVRSARPESIRFGLTVQHAFLAAVAAALYLLTRWPHATSTGWKILGVGLVTAGALRNHTRWITSWAFAAFALCAVSWRVRLPGHVLAVGSPLYWNGLAELAISAAILVIALARDDRRTQVTVAAAVAAASLGAFVVPLEDSGAALLTLIGVAVVAAAGSRRAPSLLSWAGVALIFAHVLVLRQAAGLEPAWREGLVLLTVVDAAVLSWAPLPSNAGITLLTGAMLATLYFGYAEARLPWSATFVWVPLAAGTFLLGFWRHQASYRLAALGAFGACLVRLFARDLNTSATRIAASFLLGVILLGIGYLYSRLNGRTVSGSMPPSPPEHTGRPTPSPPA